MSDARAHLEALARFHGLEVAYHDALGTWRVASDEALLGMLASLGVALEGPGEAAERLHEARLTWWRRVLEPVYVTWDGGPPEVRLHLRADGLVGEITARIGLEQGGVVEHRGRVNALALGRREELSGEPFVEAILRFSDTVPDGYHDLSVEVGGVTHRARLIAAPTRAFMHPDERSWGVFAPVYALRSGSDLGCGGLRELEALLEWTGGLGAGVIGTLPLLATFLDVPFDPSPYAPVSRLFWNELFVDIERLPELASSAEARAHMEAPAFRREVEALRGLRTVDYRRQMALVRPVLEMLARTFFEGAGDERDAFDRWIAEHPRANDYARFRATVDRRREPFWVWPERMRDGVLEDSDFDPDDRRYHLWAQWRIRQQLFALSAHARDRGPGLYLDLPLGTHPDGYDAFRERHLFLPGCAAGAPPDALFTGGQNWGFAPLHPEAMRADGYGWVRDCLREQMSSAGVLRIDHVMWLHRIFCVPHGIDKRDGVYLRYRPEELYAVLTLESQRHRCMVVGEDLGTVPPEVREAMRRHDVQRLYVLPFEVDPSAAEAVRPARPDTVASLGTHDMAPFAAFLAGTDIERWLSLGLLDEAGAQNERLARERVVEGLITFLQRTGALAEDTADPAAVTAALLGHLGASDARVLLVTLEDLWLELRSAERAGDAAGARQLASQDGLRPRGRPGDARCPRGPRDRRSHKERGQSMSGGNGKKPSTKAPPKKRKASPKAAPKTARARSTRAKGPGEGSPLTDDDLYLFNEGSHFRLYEKLGAHARTVDGSAGT